MTADWVLDGILKGSTAICPLIAKYPQHCPIAAGPLSVDQSFTIPTFLPNHVTAQANLYDQNNQEIYCVKLDLTF